eukprot:UN18054
MFHMIKLSSWRVHTVIRTLLKTFRVTLKRGP